MLFLTGYHTLSASSANLVVQNGLLGHLLEMCKGSKVSASIDYSKLPLIDGILELAKNGFIPGGTKNNLNFVFSEVMFRENSTKEEQYIMADAQTSGGLLISLPKNKTDALQQLLKKNNCLSSSIIGEVHEPKEFSIYIN